MNFDLCITSYNSRGFNVSKQDFVRELSNVCGSSSNTIICNQENFILKSNIHIIKNALPEHYILFKPALKESLEGRPKNGMFIALPITMREKVKDVSPSSFRLQAAILDLDHHKLLLLNTYFPTDSAENEVEAIVLCAEIKKIIEENEFDMFLWTGDVNCDFNRHSSHVKLLDDILTKLELMRSWNRFPIDFTHITEKNGRTFTSTIDHFFWSKSVDSSIEDAGVITLPDNMSDHCPIYCKLKLSGRLYSKAEDENTKKIPMWKSASEAERDRYCKRLDSLVKSIKFPKRLLRCKDVTCTLTHHLHGLDDIMEQLLKAVEISAREHIPILKQNKIKRKKNDIIPRWKSDIKPLKEDAYFWNAVWKSAGKPMNCQLHEVMKRTRNKYHFQIKRNKKMVNALKRNNLLNSCLDNNLDIFKEIRRLRKSKPTKVCVIDGHTNDIPEYLASKYNALYNGVDDTENIRNLESELNTLIKYDGSISKVRLFDTDALIDASKKLNQGKVDPTHDITSDMLSNAPDSFFKALSNCLQGYMIHGHVSDALLISTMVPIIKDKLGDCTSSSNYRSIAISSLILKVFDNAIINTFKDNLVLDELQFGYQSGISTSMCTWLASETINYFLRNGSDVYISLMDISKAFDTVQHSTLFKKLLGRGMPSIVVRFILVGYKEQKANVRWGNKTSEYFSISNGVKQGAVLSAVLYCVYTNELFNHLRRLKIGCHLGGIFVGCLGYADDIFLLCPTVDGLQKMLNVCENFAAKHNLEFSTNPNPQKSKTKCIAFLQNDKELPSLKLCGNSLPWVTSGKHLGVKIESVVGKILSQDILEKRAQFIQKNNELLQEFSFAHHKTKIFINQIYNSSFYGSILWDFQSKEFQMLCNTWNIAVRIMLGLDRKTHRYFIEPLSGTRHLRYNLLKRFLGFTERLRTSNKHVVKKIFEYIKHDCESNTGNNLRSIMIECNAVHIDKISRSSIDKLIYQKIPTEDEWRLEFVKELLEIKDNQLAVDLNRKDIDDILRYVCTS